MRVAAICIVASLCLLFASRTAVAAALRTEVGARKVGVGQSFEVKLTATQEDGEPDPQNPQLPVRGNARVRGPSVGTQHRVTMRNFSFNSESNVVATWVVTPTEKGKVVVGPGTFQVGTRTLRGETIVVEVVDEPQMTRRRDPFGGGMFGPDPSDIFGDDPFDLFSRRMGQSLPDAPTEYQVTKAPDPVSFLRIIVDKKTAVLGEPIRLSVLAYGSRGNFQEVSPNEPSFPDFLSYSVIETSHDEPSYQTEIDGEKFIVKKLREYILVPLRTGDLRVLGMAAVLQGARASYPIKDSPLGMRVVSPDLDLKVVDTPEEGKPAGYFPGDVGTYELEVDVTPRTLEQGEYAEAIVQVSGAGQIPTKVLLPESKAVTWEPPTMRGGPEVRDGQLKGTRVLKYALKINSSGTIDLGEVTLPFYDYTKRRYQVARADLGTVIADGNHLAKTPSNLAQRSDLSTDAPLDGGIPLEERSQPLPSAQRSELEVPQYLWWILFGTPAGIGTGVSLGSRLKSKRRSRRSSNRGQPSNHLKSAKEALALGQRAGGYRFLEKALYDALDRTTQSKTRGHLRERLAPELLRKGLPSDLAEACQATLVRLEALRFDAHVEEGDDLLVRVQELIKKLGRLERRLAKRPESSGAGR